jgi:integral membrane protein (TIGR01906 family)
MALVSDPLARSAGSILVGAAAAIVVLAVAILPFLTPTWVSFAQDRAQATAWTGLPKPELTSATNAILVDLVTGGDFVVELEDGEPVLNDREIGHMQDVQRVFAAFAILAVVSAVVLVASRRIGREARWNAVRSGLAGLVLGLVIVGIVGAFAFEQAFEVFHRLFFPGGSYTFDPSTERLVQIFPQQFWFETAMAVGVVAAVLAVAVILVGTWRLRRPSTAAASALPDPAR